MKRLFALLTIILFCTAAYAQSEPKSGEATAPDAMALWEKANAAYNSGDYTAALASYEAITAEGLRSAPLYYNMANAYFKQGDTAHAILFYHRALRLAPADEDIRHNLEYAEQSTKDTIDEIPEFFLSTWMRSVRNLMGGNTWTILSIVMLALALAMALLYLLAQPLTMRKTGFYSMAVFGLLFIITTSFAWSARTEATAQRDAIIMSSAASIKSSPDSNSTELFVLHEGTKVRVGEVMDKWAEVRIADGRKGWIEIDRIERI